MNEVSCLSPLFGVDKITPNCLSLYSYTNDNITSDYLAISFYDYLYNKQHLIKLTFKISNNQNLMDN